MSKLHSIVILLASLNFVAGMFLSDYWGMHLTKLLVVVFVTVSILIAFGVKDK